MEIKGSTPKEVEYIHKLLFKFQPQGTISKIWRKLRNGGDKYSRRELAGFLSHKDDDHAYQFLNKLIEEDVLIHAGKRETASGTVEVWRLSKKRLLDFFVETDYYQQNRDLFSYALQKKEDFLEPPI